MQTAIGVLVLTADHVCVRRCTTRPLQSSHDTTRGGVASVTTGTCLCRGGSRSTSDSEPERTGVYVTGTGALACAHCHCHQHQHQHQWQRQHQHQWQRQHQHQWQRQPEGGEGGLAALAQRAMTRRCTSGSPLHSSPWYSVRGHSTAHGHNLKQSPTPFDAQTRAAGLAHNFEQPECNMTSAPVRPKATYLLIRRPP